MPESRSRLTIDCTRRMAAGVAERGLSEGDLDRRQLRAESLGTARGTALPFDQPGSEEANQLACAATARSGFSHIAQILATAREPDPRYRFP